MEGDDYIKILFALIKGENALRGQIKEGDNLGMLADQLTENLEAQKLLEKYK